MEREGQYTHAIDEVLQIFLQDPLQNGCLFVIKLLA